MLEQNRDEGAVPCRPLDVGVFLDQFLACALPGVEPATSTDGYGDVIGP